MCYAAGMWKPSYETMRPFPRRDANLCSGTCRCTFLEVKSTKMSNVSIVGITRLGTARIPYSCIASIARIRSTKSIHLNNHHSLAATISTGDMLCELGNMTGGNVV